MTVTGISTSQSLPMTTEDRMVKALDTNGNGVVNRDEFVRTALQELWQASYRRAPDGSNNSEWLKTLVPKWAEQLRNAFARADLDHNGTVNAQEMKAGLKDPSLIEGSPYQMRNMTVSAVAFRKSLALLNS